MSEMCNNNNKDRVKTQIKEETSLPINNTDNPPNSNNNQTKLIKKKSKQLN